jgi:K+-transporting ATPase ATPase C chain
MTGMAQAVLPVQANGWIIVRNGEVAGSALIGQNFTQDRYFQPRPSATSAPDPQDSTKTVDAPYNASNSTGSNLGPLSQRLIDRVKEAVGNDKGVPADAVTTSGSGLDPHITPANALDQAPRVAKARSLPEDRIRALIDRMTERPALELIGERRVNVLLLNIALDELK